MTGAAVYSCSMNVAFYCTVTDFIEEKSML